MNHASRDDIGCLWLCIFVLALIGPCQTCVIRDEVESLTHEVRSLREVVDAQIKVAPPPKSTP